MNFRLFRSLVWLIGLCLPLAALASQKQEARVTGIVQDVQLVAADGATHAASANESVREGMTARTGAASRVELTFTDQTIARLGANSAFDFKDGTRNLQLKEGAMLLQVPRSARGAKIQTAGFAAAIPGTTIVLESYPTHYKFLVLDGTGRLFRPGHLGDSVLVNAGQMVFGQPKGALTDPVDFDIGRFLKTCRFIVDFPALRSEASIASESQKQQREKSKKNLIDTNLVIFGGGTLVSLVDPTQKDAVKPPPAKSSPAPVSNDLGSIETLKPSQKATDPATTPSPPEEKPQ
jgi:hypothetical protein